MTSTPEKSSGKRQTESSKATATEYLTELPCPSPVHQDSTVKRISPGKSATRSDQKMTPESWKWLLDYTCPRAFPNGLNKEPTVVAMSLWSGANLAQMIRISRAIRKPQETSYHRAAIVAGMLRKNGCASAAKHCPSMISPYRLFDPSWCLNIDAMKRISAPITVSTPADGKNGKIVNYWNRTKYHAAICEPPIKRVVLKLYFFVMMTCDTHW
jgi:hypothetical protein